MGWLRRLLDPSGQDTSSPPQGRIEAESILFDDCDQLIAVVGEASYQPALINICGSDRWERVRFVVIPHLAPLATFVALMQLMDNFRVFEPIISFNAAANATSLSFLIYSSLNTQTTQLFGSAAATSVITIGFIAVLIVPVLLRIARELSVARS